MIGIRYREAWLDTDPSASLSWELNNLVFVDADPTKLPGSFSFPYTLPATAHNRALLNYPDRVDNADTFIENASVQVYYQGKALFLGTMKITDASLAGIRVYIIVNPLSEIKKIPLNEIDLGGERTYPGISLPEHMLAVTTDHLEYDYVFFPVYNTHFVEKPLTNPKADVQNWFDATTGEFDNDHDHPAVMPFVRVDYLLGRIFAGVEYAFENGFQVDDELRSLYVYNNRSVWNSSGYPSSINLQNHVSKTKANSFLRKLAGAFCLGFFYNPWSKVLKMLPVQSLVTSQAKHDWTDRLIGHLDINSSENRIERFTWLEDDTDGAWLYNADERKANESPYLQEPVLGAVLYADLGAEPDGLYFVPDKHAYYRVTSGAATFVYATMGSEPVSSGEPVFKAECQGLWDISLIAQEIVPVHQALSGATWPTSTFDLLPHIDAQGTVEYFFTDDSGTALVQQENDCPDRLMFYRGMYPNVDGNNYPLASGIPYDNNGNVIGQYSLRWDGEQGMYARWWSAWHRVIRHGKHVSATLRLTITDIMNFNFEEKVRIGNQEYFVKRLRLNFTPRGIALVNAEMVSII